MKMIQNYITRYISIRYGLAGALFLGTIVFAINYESGVEAAMTAALKQGTYTFIFGGAISALCERFAAKKQYLMSIFVPYIIAVTATYTLHSFKGTPNPELSTVPTLFFAPLGFVLIATRKRKEMADFMEQQPIDSRK